MWIHARPCRFKGAGGLKGIFRHLVGGGKVAFVETDTGAVFDVDCRQDDHTAPPISEAKLRRMARPTLPLFSGWNCAPKRFPRPTNAGISAP